MEMRAHNRYAIYYIFYMLLMLAGTAGGWPCPFLFSIFLFFY